MTTARSYAEAGIRKVASEPVYPNDILADPDVVVCELTTRGAWYEILFYLWRSGGDRISKTVEGYSKLWRVSPVRAQVIIRELEENNVCEVIRNDKPLHVTTSNIYVTLVSRRLNRRLKHRAATARRVQRYRKRKCNDGVTDVYTPPSLSLSSSLSPSSSESKGEKKTPQKKVRVDPSVPENAKHKDDYLNLMDSIPETARISYGDFLTLFHGSRNGMVITDVIVELCALAISEPANRWEQYGPVKCLGWMLDDIAKRYRVERKDHGSEPGKRRAEKLGREYTEPARPPPVIRL